MQSTADIVMPQSMAQTTSTSMHKMHSEASCKVNPNNACMHKVSTENADGSAAVHVCADALHEPDLLHAVELRDDQIPWQLLWQLLALPGVSRCCAAQSAGQPAAHQLLHL